MDFAQTRDLQSGFEHQSSPQTFSHNLGRLQPVVRARASTLGSLFHVSPNIDTETLLANAAENLESANQMAATLAFDLDEPHRAIILGIQQIIDLSALLVIRAQEQVAPAASPATA